MPDATSYAKLGYLMLKKESTAGTAVYPDTPVEILSENIAVNWDITPVTQVSGKRSANIRPSLNQVGPFEGTIELYGEVKNAGHFFTSLFGEAVDSTITASVAYNHDFEPLTTLKSYTMDIKAAGGSYVTRYFGVIVKKLTMTKDGNLIKFSLDVTAQRVFQNARITVAAASGTALSLDQTSGLVAGSDSLLILDATAPSTTLATLTVTTVTSETLLVVSTIGVSLDVDDIAVIAAQTLDTEDYDQADEFIFAGGADVYVANGSNSMQKLAAKTNVEDFEVSIENEIEPRWSATGTDVVDRMPANMLVKGVAVTGKFTQFHTTPEFLDMLRQDEQVGLRFNFFGAALAANSAVAASGTVETNGVGTLSVTVDVTGEAGNDYAILIVQGTSTLSASLSSKLITVTLASVAGNNTTALVATAIDALSGVACASTGADLVTTADNLDKIDFSGGRDASERALMQIDLPNARLSPFNANLSAEDIVNEEIPFVAYWDTNDEHEIHINVRNSVADY